MAYANPAFGILHAGAVAGFGAITPKNAMAAGQGVERLVDSRTALLAKFAASAPDHDVEVNRGTGTLEAVDRLWIPAGHNLSGSTVTVFSGASSPASTNRGSVVATSAAVHLAFTSNTQRFVRVAFSGTGQWEMGELWITRYRQTVRGIDPGWEAPVSVPTVVMHFATHESTALLGPPRRIFHVTFHDVEEGSADATLLGDVANLGRAAAFLFWPPSSGALPFIARLQDDGSREQDSPAPLLKLGHEYGFRLIEQTI